MRVRTCAAAVALAAWLAPTACHERPEHGDGTRSVPAGERPAPSGPGSPSLPAVKEPTSGQVLREPIRDVGVGERIERRFHSWTTHAYRTRIAAGSYVETSLREGDVDVALVVTPPGAGALHVDRLGPPHGRQLFGVVVEEGGDLLVEVAPRALGEGATYRLRIDSRVAGAPEFARAAAFATAVRAEELWRADRRISYERARAMAAGAARAWHALGEQAEEAFALRREGEAAIELGDAHGARAPLERSYVLSTGAGDLTGAAHGLGRLAVVHRLCGRRDAAALSARALALARQARAPLAEARAYHNEGKLAHARGASDVALSHYRAGRAIFEARGALALVADVLYDEGVAYTLLGRFDDARLRAESALQGFRDAGAVRGQGRALTQLGWLHHLEGDEPRSLDRCEEALTLLRRADIAVELPGVLDRRATILLKLARPDEALASYREALEFYELTGQDRFAARVRANIALIDARRGERRAALGKLDEAVTTLRAFGDEDALADVLLTRAEVRSSADLDGALVDAEEAHGLLELQRRDVEVASSRATYLAARHKFVAVYVDVLMRLDAERPGHGYAVRAFEAAESGRARGQLDTLAAARGSAAIEADRGGDDRLLERIAEAATARHRLLAAHANAAILEAAERRLRELMIEREERARRAFAGARDTWTQAQPLGLDGIRRAVLDEDTLLLAYLLGEERSFLWLVGREAFRSYTLPSRAKIERLAERLQQLLPLACADWERGQALLVARELADIVVRPLHKRLGGKRLLVVADGALHYVPFGVLPVLPEDERAHRVAPPGWPAGRVPLVVEHELASAPSPSVLAALRLQALHRRAARRRLAVVADAVFEPGDSRLAATWPDGRRPASPSLPERPATDLWTRARAAGFSRFMRLPHTRREAEALLALVPAEQRLEIIGFDATRQAVLEGRLKDALIVHFATHGWLDARWPELSSLVLSLVDAAGHEQNGFLRLHELDSLRLSAEMVVLSACRTALGREMRGEGIVGLPQAFMHAGAPRVVVSLWNVNDRATATLMTHFYEGVLRGGRPPAEALRAAQIRMLADREFGAPGYWAAFVLDGDWRAIENGPTERAEQAP